MLIAAVIIGVLTAYYFGFKAGGVAAGASGLLFLLALVMPGNAPTIYVLVAIGVIGVLLVGPKKQKPGARKDILRWTRRLIAGVWRKLR